MSFGGGGVNFIEENVFKDFVVVGGLVVVVVGNDGNSVCFYLVGYLFVMMIGVNDVDNNIVDFF